MRFKDSIVIDAPIDKVWQYIALTRSLESL